jgi:hypothetical protein
MTKEEAINTLDGLQKAVRALDANKAREAFNALLNTSGVVTTAFNLGIEFGSALGTVRRVFDAIEEKGFRFPN